MISTKPSPTNPEGFRGYSITELPGEICGDKAQSPRLCCQRQRKITKLDFLIFALLNALCRSLDHALAKNHERDYCLGPERYGARSLSRPLSTAMKQTPLCSVTAPTQPS